VQGPLPLKSVLNQSLASIPWCKNPGVSIKQCGSKCTMGTDGQEDHVSILAVDGPSKQGDRGRIEVETTILAFTGVDNKSCSLVDKVESFKLKQVIMFPHAHLERDGGTGQLVE